MNQTSFYYTSKLMTAGCRLNNRQKALAGISGRFSLLTAPLPSASG